MVCEQLIPAAEQKVIGDACRPAQLLPNIFGVRLEDIHYDQELLPAEQQSQARQLAEEGQRRMEARHGNGFPHYEFVPYAQEGPVALLGHNNGAHTRNMSHDATALDYVLRRPTQERALHDVAARWHDLVQTVVIKALPRTGQDELESAEAILKRMREEEMDARQASIVAHFVAGTQLVTDDEGNILGQIGALLPKEAYPSEEAYIAGRVGACSDLGRLFSPDYAISSLALFLQRQGCRTVHDLDSPTLSLESSYMYTELERYFVGQLTFTQHRFALPEADKLFAVHRPCIQSYAQEQLRWLQNGTTTHEEISLRALWREGLAFQKRGCIKNCLAN